MALVVVIFATFLTQIFTQTVGYLPIYAVYVVLVLLMLGIYILISDRRH